MESVSIVLPAYNAAAFLRHTVEGVLRQSYDLWTLIIVDDGSADATAAIAAEIAESDTRIQVLRQANGGVAAARNAGYSHAPADADYVIFLDHDDIWEPHALDMLLTVLHGDSAAVAAYGLARYIDDNGEPIRLGELENAQRSRMGFVGGRLEPWPVDQPTTTAVTSHWSYITSPGQVLIRRSAMPGPVPFDQSVAPADDWDLWFRLTLKGDIRLIDRVVLNYRLHDRNESNDSEKMEKACLRARRKFLRLSNLTDDQRDAVLGCYRIVEREKAAAHSAALKSSLRGFDVLGIWDHGTRALRATVRSRKNAP
jgi:glycosyltransferase involved in cell wall biosynthesis